MRLQRLSISIINQNQNQNKYGIRREIGNH